MSDQPPLHYPGPFLCDLLGRVRTIAIVGASARPDRPSYQVMAFLQRQGYRCWPINPGLAGQTLLGELVYPSLTVLPEPVEMVDIFRQSEAAGAIVDEAIACGVKVVWMQLGVRDDAAAARATAAGLVVVMDRCPKIELLSVGLPPEPGRGDAPDPL